MVILFVIAGYMPVYAQINDTAAVQNKSHLRISLLTCSPGEEIWETFGHSCIRVIDSTKSGRERDVVYNYGFLESSEDNTVMHQFLTGRVQVFLATNTYAEFNYQYTDEKRGVVEQVFLLDDAEEQAIVSFLKNNARKENRYYEYNTVYDNCSTRILGMFEKTFGKRFVPGQVIPKDVRLTFRELTDRCGPQKIQHKYWFALGMKIFFGSRSDRIADNRTAMYLADYLCDGMDSATIDGRKLCTDKTTIIENKIHWPDVWDEPVIVLIIAAIITIAGIMVKRLRTLGNLMSIVTLIVTGLIGCYLLYFWAIDAEPCWKDNFNILWALPTNLIIPFCGPRVKAKYAVVALCLLGTSLVLDILRVQELPLYEIASLLLALLFIYGKMYRKGTWDIKSS